MADLKVNIGNVQLKNPVLTASGTFGYGFEFDDFFDVNLLGGIIVKGTTLEHREGNLYPRMAETPMGMLNAVGLQNKGIEYFVSQINPKLKKYNTHVIVNVSGSKIEDYLKVVEQLNDLDNIQAIELNISCPNVKTGGMAFGTSCESAAEITKEVRRLYKKTLIVKLSPNVTDIVAIAKSVEHAGADAISLINTLLGMAVNIKDRKPLLSTITGGLSGPAIKPIALRMVWQVCKAVKVPVIGLGGIMNAQDALEFILCGASAVQIGTANFIDPCVSLKIVEGIDAFFNQNGYKSIDEFKGSLIT